MNRRFTIIPVLSLMHLVEYKPDDPGRMTAVDEPGACTTFM
ncbi:MAG: hypothetical protein SCH71_14755 [Desulfobulbaceae bacterium]|nr:hypothetical protein [Desulfobulbaceae bacterium]